MPYRRRRTQNNQNGGDDGGVKGPSSALTSFLREQGINAEQIRQRYEQTQRIAEEPDGSILQGDLEPVEEDHVEISSENNNIPLNFALDSDEEEVVDDSNSNNENSTGANQGNVNKRQKIASTTANGTSGAIIYCLECDQEFKVSVYSKKMEKYGRVGYLCPSCTKIHIRRERLAKKHEIEARKRRKKIAAALLDKKQFKLPSLQDFCINVITENINDVELLGEIGSHNKMKICRILAKNRSLNNKTIPLFLDNDTTELEFWDCCKVDKNSLDKIAAYCPKLESLTLNMCGQLHNDNLKYFGSKLSNLKSLSLNGPFLINDDTWQSFFESTVGKHLKHFHLKNTHRFSNDSLISLLENCGNNLESLSLSRLDGLNSKPVYDLLPHFLTNLKHLEISYPHNENLIDDDMIINLLSVNCDTLASLNLNKCSGLTNKILSEGIKFFGANLTKLSLVDLDQIDDTGLNDLFTNWDINGGLTDINLERCVSLTDKSVYQMLSHSNQTLVQLNLNSVKDIGRSMFSKLSRSLVFPLLTYLDIGFVRSVDDSVLAIISRICPKLEILEIYGNNRCTDKAIIRDNLTVIGRQTDSI
jgi:DNA repair protein RAD7